MIDNITKDYISIIPRYLYHIINRKQKTAPKDDIIKKIAVSFHVEPEYFFEYRLRKHVEILEKNPKLLDKCEELLKKPKKEEIKK